MVMFVGVSDLSRMVRSVGVESFLRRLAGYIETDFLRWNDFRREPRYASHSRYGVVELMPTTDGERFSFKYVNGHPGNTRKSLQTVAAFGVLSSVETGYPLMVSEMTLLTALRTAAMSALAASHLAAADSRTMAMIGLGAQSEFQALAFKALVGIEKLRVYDVDPRAVAKFVANLSNEGLRITATESAGAAVVGSDIITTITADKAHATVLSDNMVGSGVHINAVGGDCPGKTELAPGILKRAAVFVEYAEQTRIEGEIQQMPSDFPVTEMWQVISGKAPGRTTSNQITIFDSVGFAIEDFAALRLVHDLAGETGFSRSIDLLPVLDDPKNLFGRLLYEDAPSCVSPG